MKLSKSQSGVTPIVLVLIIVLVGIIGFSSWRVYYLQKKTNASLDRAADNIENLAKNSQLAKIYRDTAGNFTLSYPHGWTVHYPENGKDYPDDQIIQPVDWSKTSRPVEFKPMQTNSKQDNNIQVTYSCEHATIDSTRQHQDQFHSQEAISINGYEAIYDKLSFKNDAESYLDHIYVIEDKNRCATIAFRENHRHGMSDTDFDDSHNLDGFKTIVNSFKFVE